MGVTRPTRRQVLSIAMGGAASLALGIAPRPARGAAPAWTTLAGPFVQERTLGLFKSTVRSQGKMLLARPDRLRWELLAPDAITYWATPDTLAYRSAAGAGRVPATAGRIAASMVDLRALLAGDRAQLRARYALEEAPTAGGGVLLEATPREGTGAPFKKLTLEWGPDKIRPVRASLVEGPKDRTEIRFGELVLDGPVDPRLLEPPPG